MSVFETAVIFLCLTALFAYINKRFIGLPTTIGVMLISLCSSVGLILLHQLGFSALHDYQVSFLMGIDFHEVLMEGMLSMLLFAGALHVNFADLKAYRHWVGLLALFGTLASALLVGFFMYYLFPLFGFQQPPLVICLLFGALISPTDPIAVLGILKSAKAPKSVEMIISGESLLNDGMGVVLFTLFAASLSTSMLPTVGEGAKLLAYEAGGGLLLGLVLGYLGYVMIKSIQNYQTTVLITLALVLGGYELASSWHLSGPIAMVVAGLFIGNAARQRMDEHSREYLDLFWELIDEILNAILFVLIGLEIILVTFNTDIIVATVIAIFITLSARLIVVYGTTLLLKRDKRVPSNAWKILTWGGLRGGVSVALVLSLPQNEGRDALLALTYGVVLFSIVVQGLTVGKLAKGLKPTAL